MDKERALKLAKKLAAINGSNATENEAMMAAEHLARIAAEHGLTRLDWSKEEVRSNVKSEALHPNKRGNKKLSDFIVNLCNRVAVVFGVRCILIGGDWCDFIGDETNVTLVKFFLEELLGATPRLRTKAKAEAGCKIDLSWKHSWEQGFINAICERLTKIYDGMRDGREDACRALVLVTKELVDTATNEKYPHLTNTKMRRLAALNHDAYLRGMRDGQRTQLQSGIQ